MENKYIAVVYDDEMSDILKKADVLGTYHGMKADANGRYHEMDYYQIGFDYATWKELKQSKVSMNYYDKDGYAYEFVQGRCCNLNEQIKMKDVVAKAEAKANLFREQVALRDKYATESKGIVPYKEKKTNAVNNKKANSLIAYDANSELVMPFREIISGSGDLPIFVYLHDKKSRSANNTVMLLKECKNLIASFKNITEGYILVIPNVVTKYGIVAREDGRKVQNPNSLDNLLADVIDYEIQNNGGDKNRVYIMGAGSGVADALCELSVHDDMYAGAVLAFGEGWYPRNIDSFKDVRFEIVAATDDYDFEVDAIEGMAEDIKSVGANVNYNVIEGDLPQALKVFYKDTTWLSNIFEAKRGYRRATPPVAPVVAETPVASAEDVKADENTAE